MHTQSSINGQGLKLGSQLTCIVGLVFPTKGGSLPSDPMTPLSSHKLLLFISKLLSLFVVRARSLSLSPLLSIFSPELPTPFSSLTTPIYSLRLVEVSWLHSSLTRVCGVQFDYSWQGISSIETEVMALELVPTTKRLLDSDIPQDNTELPRTWAISDKHIPSQVILDRCGLLYHASKTRWTY